MTGEFAPLVAVVTTDLASITRGRSVTATSFETGLKSGVGWLPANLSLTAFNSIASPNPWGSHGDLRLLPDRKARFRTTRTGSATPFDMVMGDITELDGTGWTSCPRVQTRQAADAMRDAGGLTVRMSFEQEFQLFPIDGAALPPAHSLSFAALRRTDPFGPRLVAALEEAGVDPEVMIAEFGRDQFEITCAPADPVTAADRAIAIREIVREIARLAGWRASFAPKTTPDGVGNGVHVHFSLWTGDGKPATYDATAAGNLSAPAGAFCAGVLRHMPALLAFSAPSEPSYLRLRPNSWSASYSWLAERDREAALRICPVATNGGRDPAPQFNIEYRAADATANPYLVATTLLRAGLEGLRGEEATPALVATHPERLDEAARARFGIHRLPTSLADALDALRNDATVRGWFPDAFIDSFFGVRAAERAQLGERTPEQICELYRTLY